MNTENTNKLEQHQQRFLEANQFIKTTKVNKQQGSASLHQSPWFLVLGTPNSGKTSLLSQSEISFSLARKETDALKHDDVNWWVSKSAVYLDLPPQYLTEPTGEFYQLFLKQVKKHSHNKQVNALVVVVSLKEVLAESTKKSIGQLTQMIKQAQLYLGKQIPVYFVINQMDWLTGFNEFFSAYAKDERQQAWGISQPNSKPALDKWLNVEFDDLISRLNQQVIWRLHHEPDASKRPLIKDFPLQFNHSKEKLIAFITRLKQRCEQQLNLKGVYFCSASQSASLDTTYLSETTQLVISKSNPSRAYFVHELLQSLIPNTKTTTSKKLLSASKLHLTCYSLLILAGIAGIGLFTMNFANKTHAYQQAQQSLTSYQQQNLQGSPNSPQQFDKMLTSVSKLGKASKELTDSRWQTLMPGGVNDRHLQHRLKTIYQQALNRLLIPNIKLTLEALLQSPEKLAPNYLYTTLNAYLMLTQPGHLDKQIFSKAMRSIWAITLVKQPKLQTLLNKELQQVLNKQTISVRPNYQLIAKAKQAFNQLSPAQQAFALLINQVNTQLLTINFANNPNAKKVLALTNPELGLPSLYTLGSWKQLQETAFTSIARQVKQGNAIINPSSSLSLDQLETQLQTLYFRNYAKHWAALLNNITLRTPNNLTAFSSELNLLASDNSPLIALASLIKQNVPEAALKLSPKLSLFVADFQASPYQSLQQALSQLSQYLAPANSPQAAFELTKQRFLNQGRNDAISQTFALAQQTEGPVRYWLYQLANDSWTLLLSETQQWIDNQWQQKIWFSYVNQIQNRYPFGDNTNDPASLASFINFFAPNGLLDHFFSSTIEPFINLNQQPWQPLALNGHGLNFKASLLKAFATAQNLQQQFFPLHDQHLSIPFKLKSLRYSVGLKSMKIQLGNQQVSFMPYQDSPIQALTWPDTQNSTTLNLIFTNSSDQQEKLQLKNPWALWEVFNDQHFHPVAGQKNQWIGLLQKGQDAIELQLTSNTNNNPFSLAQLQHFKLNKSLFT